MPVKQKDTILIVEDEPAISQICMIILNKLGFDVDVAIDGQAAKDKLKNNDYALLLIDMRTPRINGSQLYKYIKESYPHLINRVVFTTGDVLDGSIQDFLSGTGRPILPKPFTPDQLISIVRNSLMSTGR